MDADHADGIVLRRQPVTETSLIVTWYTRQFGKLKTIAKGARRAKGPFLGRIDLFFEEEIVIVRSRRSDLHILHECAVTRYRQGFRGHPDRLASASYACELVDLGTEVEDPHPSIYELLTVTLDALESRPGAVTLLWFEMQLLAMLGWKPNWKHPTPATRMLASLSSATLDGSRRIRLTPSQLTDTRATLWALTDEHLGKPPRSRLFLSLDPVNR
jgi:DNA repair protein RecO (recombination protein O)